MIRIILAIIICFMSMSAYADLWLTAPHDFNDETAKQWRDLSKTILETKESVIHIVWSGYGGQTVMMKSFAEVLEEAEASGKEIIFVLDGPAYSAHAFAACYATSIENNDQFPLMFHRAAYADGSLAYNAEVLEYVNRIFDQCAKKNLLNNLDIQHLNGAFEVWVTTGSNGQYIKKYKLDERIIDDDNSDN